MIRFGPDHTLTLDYWIWIFVLLILTLDIFVLTSKKYVTRNNKDGVSGQFRVNGSRVVIVMEGGIPKLVQIPETPIFQKYNLRFNCNPQIEHSDASNFVRNHRLSAKDKRVMQGVYTLLNEEPNWVWRNAIIEVHGENISLTFFAGSQSNQFVVNLNENDGVSSSCRAKGYRLRLSDGVKSIWNGIKSGAKVVLGSIGGGGLDMLDFFDSLTAEAGRH